MSLVMENKKILEFLELVGRLKHVKRTGWVICDIEDCESIAGHMYRMGLMTFLLTEKNNPTKLDRYRCLEIALIHDLAECIVGDLTPHCGVSPEEKHRREDEAMKTISELTGIAGDRMYEIYKHVKRTGWVICDIEDCESIAGHMYRMGLMTFLLTEKNNPTKLDRYRCLEIALIHDLAECIVGDLTPHCGVSPEEKHRREDEAMKTISELTGIAGDRMYEIYKEYENQSSPEAKFAKDLDRYDMILQAFEYEKRQKEPKKLEEFFTVTYGKFDHPFIKDLAKELYIQREEFEKQSLVKLQN